MEVFGLELPLRIPLYTSLLEVSLTVSLFESLRSAFGKFVFECEAFKTGNISSLLKVAALSGVYDCIVFVIDVKLVTVSTVSTEMLVLRI